MSTIKAQNRVFGIKHTLGKTVNDAVEFDNTLNYSSMTMHVNTPTGGLACFEATVDGVNWAGITMRSIDDDVLAQTTDNGSDFIGSVSGIRKFRVRTCTEGSADGDVVFNFTPAVNTIENIEFGYPPHRFGYLPIHKDFETETAGTYSIWTPASGKKFVVTDLSVIASGSTDGVVTIFDETNETGKRIFRSAIEVSTNKQFVFMDNMNTPYLSTTDDNILKVTTSTDVHIDVMVKGYEI